MDALGGEEVERFFYGDDGEIREASTALPIALSGERSASPLPTSALVVFSPEARQTIMNSASWGTGNQTEKETGGPLLGRFLGHRVEVVAATTAAKNRTAHSVELSLRGHGRLGLVTVGDWHSHAGADGTPSPIDRSGWESAYRSARPDGCPFWIAVVAAVEKFKTPILRAWTVDLDGLHPLNI